MSGGSRLPTSSSAVGLRARAAVEVGAERAGELPAGRRRRAQVGALTVVAEI